ncbi:exodeoxyribonuclease V subunit alpha [Thiocystis violascens]|uniref:RecBCD enzyme subunit RecD n=1 Tax=Thiocystis violascens (strain ATCC 17096 / DSM 198 / 6111) TaxID=765911 RepID=I3YAG6_THIV6|nr:exodeoxyribonuclease V subunit alpha [Thiocystis violascens]AFL73984.1 DNA helicase/exodeoxyribonuclease V, alpha subunit [Thiocystis violascens DSM 198]
MDTRTSHPFALSGVEGFAPVEAEDLLARLRAWADAGALRALDLALTRFIHRHGPETDTAVLLAVALTSERNGHGHVCLDLAGARERPDALLTRLRDDVDTAAEVRADLSALLRGLTLADWVGRLSRSPAVHNRLDRDATDDAASPLVLEGTPARPLLYLRRYWRYESRILDGIRARLDQRLELPETDLRALLDALFVVDQDAASDPCDWQKIACALAARSAFAIVTGGPGTGKTTTVVRLLALLQGLAIGRGQPPLRIRLAAPTGKAAARLNESIAARVADLPLDAVPNGEQVRREIPTEVTTLHRLLGSIPDSRHFRHHAGHPLPADLVVVDEASMVDVEMMARLLEALRPDARLILLGDKDQLASVEAGAVLGDLCQRARAAHYLPVTRDWLRRVTGATIPDTYLDDAGEPLDQAIVMLRKSYRFKPEGGIGALAALVNDDRRHDDTPERQPPTARLSAVLSLFERQRSVSDGKLGRIDAIQLRDTGSPEFAALVRDGYRAYLTRMRDEDPGDDATRDALDRWARAVLKAQEGFQLLTALRQGPWGVEGLNRRIVEVLKDAGLLSGGDALGTAGADRHWFAGRPVLVTRNDYGLHLMNGDIGITLALPLAPRGVEGPALSGVAGPVLSGVAGPVLSGVEGAELGGQEIGARRRVLRVAFPAGDGSGGIRWILPSRLQAVETVFAMTVHKSQGSEFDHTVLILPDTSNPVLTRELVYTGITRSRHAFTLLYREPSVLGDALERRVRRVSGIGLSRGQTLDECNDA